MFSSLTLRKSFRSGGLGVRSAYRTGLASLCRGGEGLYSCLYCCCCWIDGLGAICCLSSFSDGDTSRPFSWTYSSTQKSLFGRGLGTDLKRDIGFSGILISGRQPIGGGSKDCGDFLLLPFVFGAESCWLLFLTGGGGPVGKTWNGMPIASDPIGGAGGGGGGGIDPLVGVWGVWTDGELEPPFELFWANGETLGFTPSLLAFAEMPVDLKRV